MARSSHKPQAQAIIENLQPSTFCDGGQSEMKARALDALNRNDASQKEWAIELRVHPSMISMWISGTKTISEESAKSILVAAEMFALQQARSASILAYEIRCFIIGRKP